MIISTSWKNIWRNKVRSLVVMFAIVLGIFGGVFSAAITMGLSEQRIKKALDNEICDIQIRNNKFSANKELQFSIQQADSIIGILKKKPEVVAISKRSEVVAMAQTSHAGTGVIMFGINPEEEKKVCKLYKTICDSCGEFLTESKKKPIVIGRKLADKLKVKVKSKIILTCQNIDGDIVLENFKVVGIYETKNAAIDEMNVYVRNSDLVAITGIQANDPHELAIKLTNKDIAPTLAAQLKKEFPNLEILSWKEINPEIGYMNDMMDVMLLIIIGIILLALGFGIVNTMLMAILERTHEIGMLMAIGMNKLRIFSMIMFESVFLTFTGAFIGMILTSFLVLYFQKHGLDIQQFGKGYESFGYDSIIYPKLELKNYIQISIMVIITGILASIYPAYKALKLKPVEAIRVE